MKHPSVEELLAAREGGGESWVDEHVRDCPTCQALQALAADGTAGAPPEPPVEALDDVVTVPRDHYDRREEVHRGGMGRATLAVDRRLGREVVLKELHPEGERRLVDRAALGRRLRTEAQLTARLQHPGIVAVYEAGQWPDGEPFYAMPFVRGRSLAETLAAAQTMEQRLELVANVLSACDAIAYAHDRGIVHRDIKPDNILVGEFGETVVIDWGLAKEVGSAGDPVEAAESEDEEEPDPAGALTRLGVGTAAYMPPEQASGGSPTPHFDVYALGATLYHVLAGVAPYAGVSSSRVRGRLVRESPTSLAELAATVPEELIAVVDKAMAREPEARFPTAGELAGELRRFTSGQLLRTHRYSPSELLRRWARRHRGILVAAGVGVIAALTIGVTQGIRVARERDRADAGEARALTELQRARGVTAQLLSRDPGRRLDALEAGVRAVGPALAAGETPVPEAAAGLLDAVSAGSAAIRFSGGGGASARSDDGQLVVTAQTGLRIWEPPAREPVAVIPLGTDHMWQVAFSPSGEQVASSGSRGEVDVVRWRTGAHARAMDDPQYSRFVRWIDEEHFVSATIGVDIKLRNGATAEVIRERKVPGLASIVIVGERVAIGTAAGAVELWDPGSGGVETLGRHETDVVGVGRAGAHLVSASLDGEVQAWAWPDLLAEGKAESRSIGVFGGRVTAIGSSRYSPQVLLVSDEGRTLVDVETGRVQRLSAGVALPSMDPHASASPLIFTAEEDGTLHARRRSAWSEVVAELPADGLRSHAFHPLPDGKVFAARRRGPILWDARPGLRAGNIPSQGAEVVAIVPTREGLASLAANGRYMHWDPEGTEQTLVGQLGTVVAAAPSLAAGGPLLVWDDRGQVTGVDVESASPSAAPAMPSRPRLPDEPTHPLAEPVVGSHRSPDGAFWLVSRLDDTAVLSPDGELLSTIPGRVPSPHRSPFSSDGSRFVTTTGLGLLRVYDRQHEARWTFAGHENVVLDAAFSADGSVLATASADGTIRRWDLATGESLGVLEGSSEATAVGVTSDGRWLMGGFADGSLRLQPLSIDAAMERACERIAYFGERASVSPHCD